MARDEDRRRRPWLRRILLLGLLLAAAGAGVWWWQEARISSSTVLVLDLRSPLLERRDGDPWGILQAPSRDLLEVRRALKAAAWDDRVKGLLLRVGAGALDLTAAEELRGLCEGLRRRGKFVLGQGTGPDGPGLLALSASDRVVLDPSADVHLLGVAITALFPGEALRRLGIELDLVAAGGSGGIAATLECAEPSLELEEALEAAATALHDSLVGRIAGGRRIEPTRVRAAMEDGPLSPARAVEVGLADRTAYPDELPAILEEGCGERVEPIALEKYLSGIRAWWQGDSRMAVVHLQGILVEGRSSTLPFLGEVTGADDAAEALRAARSDPSVKAVILRIDSPGGTLSAARAIRREVEVTRRAKPVMASLGARGSSGGYFVASAAERIFAQPSTLAGSLGLFGGKAVLGKLLEENGVVAATAAAGRRAAMFLPTRLFDDEERRFLERGLREAERELRERVAESRGRPLEDLERLEWGRPWTGVQAVERGLVDELGGLEEAVQAARKAARLGGKEEVDLEPFPARRSLLDLLGDAAGEPGGGGALLHLDPREALRPYLPLLDGRSPLALDPLGISVR